ncbi:MAG: WG repeat-containing protein [Bacteroidia bacterium]
MRILIFISAVFISVIGLAQKWEVRNHPNNNTKAIFKDSVQLTDFVFTEVSEFNDGFAYVAKGEYYGYINHLGEEVSPFVFVEAHDFQDGFAIVGDSFNRSVINDKMQVIVPFGFAQVRLPKYGLILVKSHQGKWGAYNTEGDLMLPLIYDIPPLILNKNKIIVRRNELYGVVNSCNDIEFNYSYQYISPSGKAYMRGSYLKLF